MTSNAPGNAAATTYGSVSHLPLVSVIIVNHNQGRFLREAVASVMAQTYRKIECILVDDKSIDESLSIINSLVLEFPQVKPLCRDQNGGQTAASLDGLAAARGSFVHFLDADDYVTKDFIEAHIYVHLSARFSVGFTCCDMIERHGDEILAFGNINVARFRSSDQCVNAEVKALMDIEGTLGRGLRVVEPEDILEVTAWHCGWPWSASSAFVYRRTALDIFSVSDVSKYPRHSTDTFFAYAINSMTGSIVIDEPLAFYRCHGANVHAARLPMNHVIGFDRSKMLANTSRVIESILDVEFQEAKRFKDYFWDPRYFFNVVVSLCRNHPSSPKNITRIMWHRRKSVVQAFGISAALLGYMRILAALRHNTAKCLSRHVD